MDLRPVRPDDLSAIARMHADDEWAFFARPGEAPTLERLAAAIDAAIASPDVLRWSIVDDGEVVGQVEVAYEPSDRIANLAYFVERAAWGRGLATAAAGRSIAEAFTHWPELHKVCAHIDPRNVASVRVAERCGLRVEGLLREHRLRRAERVDRLLLGLLRSEWDRR